MSFLNNQRISEILSSCVDPSIPERVKNAAYELSLGSEYYTTTSDGVKYVLNEGEQLIIKPGQFALLITKEIVTIPLNIIAFISIKASVKFCGLVNVSGFHVDPGFHGRLKFSVYNAGNQDIVLEEGQRLFPLWFCELTDSLPLNEALSGQFYNQLTIDSRDVMRIQGEVLAPSVLNEKIKELENTKIKELEKSLSEINTRLSIFQTIVVALAIAALLGFIKWAFS